MSAPTPDEIVEKWRFVDLDGTTLALSGNSHPDHTVKALRGARDDVAVLYNAWRASRQEVARLLGMIEGLKAR